jgi:hypothetical protein
MGILKKPDSVEIKASVLNGHFIISFSDAESLDDVIYSVHNALVQVGQHGWRPTEPDAVHAFNMTTGQHGGVHIEAEFTATR